MKKLLTLAMSLMVALTVSLNDVSAQTAKEERQTARALKVKDKKLDKQIKENALKDARKAAKQYTKEGYSVQPGALPLAKQIEQSWKYGYETDEDGLRTYILASQRAVGGMYSAAKTQAQALARVELAGNIAAEVAALIKTEVSNEAFTPEEVATIVNTVSASKQKISQRLGRTIQVVEISRKLKNGNTEILITLAYNTEEAINIVKQQLETELGAKADDLFDELDEML